MVALSNPPSVHPMPPVPPEGSVPPGGTGGRRVWIGVLIVGGALLFLGLLVAIAFIGADSGSTGGVTSTESNAAEEDLNEDMVSVVSEDSELQLQVPASWEDLKGDLNPAASIEVGDKFDETYAMVISDSREDFADPPSLEEFAQGQLRYFTRRLESPSLSEGINVAEYEQPAVRHELSATVDNLNVMYAITFIETDQRFVQIFAWTLASEWDDNRGILERVSNSLQELSTG